MSFYQCMERTQGKEIVSHMKTYSKLKRNLAQQLNRKIFLLNCKKEEITPNFISRCVDKLKNFSQTCNDITFKILANVVDQVKLKL